MSEKWTESQINGFHVAAQSLKLYRRADLPDEYNNERLIEQLYVDPLPKELIFNTMMKPNTTFLIGRKGTGKSTVFKRVQQELLGQEQFISAYIDIKTIYESTHGNQALISKVTSLTNTVSEDWLQKLLLYQEFLTSVIEGIKEQLKKRLASESIWDKVKERFSGTITDLFEDLDELVREAYQERFMSVIGVKDTDIKAGEKSSQKKKLSAKSQIRISKTPEVKLSASAEASSNQSESTEASFKDILIRVFNIRDFILSLREILNNASIRHLYIFVDDFSELPKEAMEIVVDTLIAPLNNWSEELIKFKIAAYPGRIYFGQIDKTKIDELYLDLYKIYGGSNISDMESKAIDFTSRLLEHRILHYCNCKPDVFFQKYSDDIKKVLFYATMGNPRILGYLLFYLYESQLIYGKRIGIRAIRDCAQRYYEDKIESYFKINKFLHEAFIERASIFSLKELLEAIVTRSRELRSYRESSLLKQIEGQPPTSHFNVVTELESLLLTLELNFFLTKYYEMSDRDGKKVSVFSLNFGLCQKQSIEFGRPSGSEYRHYYIERHFDNSSILKRYMEINQEIVCSNCGSKYEFEKLEALKLFDMTCPSCRTGHCEVVNLSSKYQNMLDSIDSSLLLPSTELGILNVLHTENLKLFASQISCELDCSYQLIGWRGKHLEGKGLVVRSKNKHGRREFAISEFGKETYFQDNQTDELDVTET